VPDEVPNGMRINSHLTWGTGLLILSLLCGIEAAHGQFNITPLKTFGTNGWLAPNGSNGSTYPYLTTNDTERGLAYANNHLYLVSRQGGDFIRILDAQTGQDLGALNLGTGIVSGGTFDVNMVAVGGEGAIYVSNLAIGPAALRVYRWADDRSTTTPTVAYNGVPLAGARVGDTLAAIGIGGSTRLVAGFNGTPSINGNNGYAILDPTAGTATAVAFSGTPPMAGDFRLGIAFTDSSHVIGTQGGAGNSVQDTSFSGGTGTLLASPALASTDERPMGFTMLEGFPLLATLDTATSQVNLYDLTDPATPVLLGQASATTGTVPADAHNTGAVAWGRVSGNTAALYAMATDGGIQAFTVMAPKVQPPEITSQPQSQTVQELSPVTLQVAATGNPTPTYQWFQNDMRIVGATNASYLILAIPLSDNGAGFHAVAANLAGGVLNSVTSRVASLTVIADTTPPELVGARPLGLSQVQVSFSERINPVTATNLDNYALADSSGSLPLVSATLDNSQTNVILQVSALAEGTLYTLTVNHLSDQSAAGNVIAPNSQRRFTPELYTPWGIGNPALAGSQTAVSGGYDITAGGSDLGGSADQCQFSYQLRTGDFDVATRLAGLSLSDVWAKAGLMARETLDPGSRFAASLATPDMVGSFFEWRNGTSSPTSSAGSFPGNYPSTWLRLQRVGNTFASFASDDGEIWTPLASATIAMPSQIYVGLVASSHNPSVTTVAQFRSLVDVTSAVVGSSPYPYERLGPCSRRTPLVISEIMDQPAPRPDGLNLEFIEIYNSNPWWEDIGGDQIDGSIHFTFPTNTIIQGGAFLVVAAAPSDLRQVYDITNVFGPLTRSAQKTKTIRLLDKAGAVLLDIPSATTSRWPAGADGTGHSIVLVRPSYGEADARAWVLSDQVGGAPGGPDGFQPSPLRNVVINEFLAHPDNTQLAYIELYNHSRTAADLSGCVLTDLAETNKFIMPTKTLIAAGGFLSFDAAQLGFRPSPAGGLLLFKAADGRQVLDAVSYEAQGLTVSSGRWPDGAADFYPLAAPTPGASNGDILIGDIVINEIMYKPISGNNDDQYVELYNQGANAVDLGGWQFTAGISFTFIASTVIAPGGYLVVARNATNLYAHYPGLNSANTTGDFSGTLPHKGGRLALARPEPVVESDGHGGLATNTVYVVEDEVTYEIGGRWGQWAHGGGSSLELIDPKTNHRLAYNWADSDETAKSAWTNLEVTGLLDNGINYSTRIDLVQVGLLDVGECLVDNLEVRSGTDGPNLLQNGDFEAGATGWRMQGDHSRSSIETSGGLGGYLSPQSLHLRSSDGVWTGANSAQGTLTNNTLANGQTATLRLVGRWLHGSPEVLMRVHGNWIELTGVLSVPPNLGSPGRPNSRAVTHAGPAIFEVKHAPALPAASQPVTVTARFHDTRPVQATLLYRIDTGVTVVPTYRSLPMLDDGAGGDAIAGDGLFSATIPVQTAGTVVAFIVQARDDLGATTVFPSDLKDNAGYPRECVVRFGDTIPTGSFGQYHLWLTQNWQQRWASFPALSNESNDGTFVDGGGRVIYNMVGRFAGSPYHQYSGSPVTTLGGMHWTMPEDDKMLGVTSFNKQHVPGNGALDDATLQREQTSYWMARQIGLPWGYRRYYILYVNGNRHGPLMEDSQVPGGDLLTEYFPNDNNGFLYKNNAWFEFDINGQQFNGNHPWCTLGRFTTVIDGTRQNKLARYRWTYWVRQYPDSANNYTNVYALIDAANTSTASPDYYSNMEAWVDTEEWLRMSAIEHATGDWDSFTTQNQWNMYSYKPLNGKWTLLKWDWNITLGNSGSWGPDGGNLFTLAAADPRMSAFLNYPPYLRAYLRAFKDIANGPMNTNNVNPVLDAKYAAFAANGLNSAPYGVAEPGANGLKRWIGTMHNSLLSAISARGMANVTFAVDGPQTITTDTNLVILTGTAPLEVKTIRVNDTPYPVAWTSVRNWSISLPLHQPTNLFAIQGYDLAGHLLTNATATLSVTDTNQIPGLNTAIAINEWMASNLHTALDPADGKAHDWLELFNPNPVSVDLTGYSLSNNPTNQTQWTIPPGTVLPPLGFLLVWADGGLTDASPSLHAPFKLNKAGGYIGLFGWDAHKVDSVTYGAQATDISEGRWPDGGPNIYPMTIPTPGLPNLVASTLGTQLRALMLSDGHLAVLVSGQAGGSYTLQTSPDLLHWGNLLTTNVVTTPFIFVDPNPLAAQQFYRVSIP
jgi:regulation of enolase protein 1 (concanavalin A-like superfamily)